MDLLQNHYTTSRTKKARYKYCALFWCVLLVHVSTRQMIYNEGITGHQEE
jgi:hypothetical protein